MGKGKVIGIDLGTTNSVVAVLEGRDSTVVINTEGGRVTPSVVAFTKAGERLVGELAKRQAVINPENTIFSIKRFMGRKFKDKELEKAKEILPYKLTEDAKGDVKIKLKDKEYSPPEVAAMILQKMKQTAEDYLGEEVIQAVITVPAHFNDSQRQATKDAGRIAGLEVLRIINEPTAASLAYGLDKKKDQKIAVFDLGGGTFDISILELSEEVFQVKSTNGNTYLGGDDFDQRIIDYLVEEFKSKEGVDLKEDEMAMQRLKEAAEKAKCELSSSSQTEITLPFIYSGQSGPKHLALTLTRAKLEELTNDLIEKTIQPCKQALADANFPAGDLDEVILVGGQTRAPAVQKLVKKLFGKEPHKGVNPEEVVALGATIQAGALSGEIKDLLLLDVTPLSLGIEILGGVFTKLIERNTTIPTEKSEVFSTASDNQAAVTIKVFQGEREMTADNRFLGNFDLVGILPAPRAVPRIKVTFDIDANGIVHVSAKDLGTGKEQKMRIRPSSGLTDQEIQGMIKKASSYAEIDKKKRRLTDARNEADSSFYMAQKALEQYGEKIDAGDTKRINQAIEKVKECIGGENAEVIKRASQEIEKILAEVSEAAYEDEGTTAEKKDRQQEPKPEPKEKKEKKAEEKVEKKEDEEEERIIYAGEEIKEEEKQDTDKVVK